MSPLLENFTPWRVYKQYSRPPYTAFTCMYYHIEILVFQAVLDQNMQIFIDLISNSNHLAYYKS